MKITSLFTCGQCSYQSSKWLGRCPTCEAWNSFAEEQVKTASAAEKKIKAHARTPKEFSQIVENFGENIRIKLGMGEVDRVLGEGLVPGSMVLLTGEPGIGKSTLTLQIAEKLCQLRKKVLYVSGEESEDQISLRGKRLGLGLTKLQLLAENNLETIIATATEQAPDFLIIDSIQVISSGTVPGGAGSVSQVRLCTEAILEFAKPKRLPVLLIGHVTKDGTLAGPRVLEHLVDTVLYLDGSRSHDFRILRSVKNRFGSVAEVGIFEMNEAGLEPVKNPASYFLQQRAENAPGSALVMTAEGTRKILLEVQALTNTTVFGYPVRKASGFDVNRLQLLTAVLQKHCHVNLGNQDIYINVVSGYRLNDPACDVGICMAILSSHFRKPLPKNLVSVGEVGLNGEIHLPKQFEKYKKEIEKLGLYLGKNHASLKELSGLIFEKTTSYS